MGDESNEQGETSGDTDRTEISIQKEISKLEYYLESADELIRANNVEEIKTTVRQASILYPEPAILSVEERKALA